ncbi:MAG: hypothetical protein ACTIJJ_03610 [Galactobacter sp.]|uniref:hypothetical protein n=1 Tax=Galactobacter sp. TaxID=2676125 RepID=UPI0025BDA027|nr:hypothetical protein [Galactobacter sp.]
MTSQYPQQPNYGYPPPYQQPYQYGPPRPVRRPPGPPGLGIAGLVMAGVALVASVIWDFVCVSQFRSALIEVGNSYDYNEDRMISIFGVAVLIQMGLSLLGTAALVVSIIATATNKGRAPGIAGIVVAGAAPIISYTVFMIAVAALPLDPEIWDSWDAEYSTVLPYLLSLRG